MAGEAVQVITTVQLVKQVAAPSGMYYGVASSVVPISGNLFVAFVDFDPKDNNKTWIQVRKYKPDNKTLLGEWRVTPTNTFKMDNLSLTARNNNLLVVTGTHTSVAGPARTRAVELATIPGVYT